MCLAQGHNAVMQVRLEPATPRSSVKHSTTELLCSPKYLFICIKNEKSNDAMNGCKFSISKILNDRNSNLKTCTMSFTFYIEKNQI